MNPNTPIFTIGKQTLYQADCRDILPELPVNYANVVVTSPPYNIGTGYQGYMDNGPRGEYLPFMDHVFCHIYNVLKDEGSFFLNMGFTSADPWVAMDVANEARKHFTLQNHFSWVKSITISGRDDYVNSAGEVIQTIHTHDSYGHFKPVNSKRYVNNCWEHIFHFTKKGKTNLDRLAVGVPYVDKSNLKRGNRGKNGDKRCRGNTWYIPYETINSKSQKGDHPAIFPEKLPAWCIALHGMTPDMLVLDPFVGTGTTLVVCEKLGIQGVGIDLDSSCINWSVERLKALQNG